MNRFPIQKLAVGAAVLCSIGGAGLAPGAAHAYWVAQYAPPPVVVGPPPVLYRAPPPPVVVVRPHRHARWIPGHYTPRGFWVPGRWI